MNNRLLKGLTAAAFAATMAVASPVLARGGGGGRRSWRWRLGGGGHGGFGGGGHFGGGGNACWRLRRYARRRHGRRPFRPFRRLRPSAARVSRMRPSGRALPARAGTAGPSSAATPSFSTIIASAVSPSSARPFTTPATTTTVAGAGAGRLMAGNGSMCAETIGSRIAVPHHCRDRHRAVPPSPGTG